jgi:SAM-dependent methyltransferase
MRRFDAKDYWERRLDEDFNLRSVGQRGWGIHFNRWAYRARRRAFLRMVRSLDINFRSADALDIGAGTGFYIDRWKELGVRSVAGIDLTDVAVNRLKEHYPECSFYKMDIGGDTGESERCRFDIVSCMDVLFHIVDDLRYRKALENVYELLRPGGFFVFSEAREKDSGGGAEYIVHRGLDDIESKLREVGFRIVTRRPFLVLMNDPVGPGKPLLRLYWRLLRKAVRWVYMGGAVAGAVLYPIELALVSLMKESPSTEIVLCQRPKRNVE